MTNEELYELDKAVARAVGLPEEECDDPPLHTKFQPTRNPADWGPLIEQFYMDVQYVEWADGTVKWTAEAPLSKGYGPWVARDGETVGEAICRAVVALGEAREGAN